MEKSKINWGHLSKYRSIIYGISGILIVLFHYSNAILKSDSALKPLARLYENFIGSVGVDIFFIMSGISLYYSLQRKFDIKSFYIKRFKRILIPYFVVAIPFWYIIDIAKYNLGFVRMMKDLFFITFFTNANRSLWYIFAICCMYLIYPFLYLLFEKFDKYREVVFVILTVLVCSFNYIFFVFSYELYDNIEVMMARIPAFILGTYIAKKVYNGENFKRIDFGILIISFLFDATISITRLIGDVYLYSMLRRYVQIMRAVVLLAVIIYVMNKFNLSEKQKFLNLCGNLSLEIYLVHVSVILVFLKVHLRVEKVLCFLIYLVLVVILVKELHLFCEKIYKWMDSNENKLFNRRKNEPN